MAKTHKQLQSEQTRQHIIQVAAQMFARKGFFGTSIADLSRAAGLTKGALYHHFESKDALFLAVIQRVRDVWRREVARDVLKAQDALDRLAVLFENHIRLVGENQTLCLVLDRLGVEVEGLSSDFAVALQETYGDLARFIERIIHKGQRLGQVRDDLDARQVALNIVGMLVTGCPQAMRCQGEEHRARMSTLQQMVLDGLRP